MLSVEVVKQLPPNPNLFLKHYGHDRELLSLDHVSYVALHLVSHHPSQAQAVATPTVAQPTYAYAANNYPAVATVVPVYPMTYDNGAVTGVH